jgi:ATP-dependent metalloprotease
MPRGRSLGMVMQLPDGDMTSMTRKQMLARMDVCMGGRIAEELIFGPENVTSGSVSCTYKYVGNHNRYPRCIK